MLEQQLKNYQGPNENEVLLLNARLEKLNKDKLRGTISYADYCVQYNRISEAFMSLNRGQSIDMLKVRDFLKFNNREMWDRCIEWINRSNELKSGTSIDPLYLQDWLKTEGDAIVSYYLELKPKQEAKLLPAITLVLSEYTPDWTSVKSCYYMLQKLGFNTDLDFTITKENPSEQYIHAVLYKFQHFLRKNYDNY